MGLGHSPSIVMDGLVLSIDAANKRSFSGSGITVFGLVGGIGGTLVNGVGFSSLNGGSFFFDGSNDHIMVSMDETLRPTQQITQEVWFKPISQGIQHFIALQYADTSFNSYVLYYVHPDLRALIQIGASSERITVSNSLTVNNWYHFVHTYDGSFQKLYVNGSSIGSSTLTGSITYDPSNTKLLIGADYNGPGLEGGFAFPANGNMGSVKIYNRALTAQEIRQNFNATKKRYGL